MSKYNFPKQTTQENRVLVSRWRLCYYIPGEGVSHVRVSCKQFLAMVTGYRTRDLFFSKIFLSPLVSSLSLWFPQFTSVLWKNDAVYPTMYHSKKHSCQDFLFILSGFFISCRKSMGPLVSMALSAKGKQGIGPIILCFHSLGPQTRRKQAGWAFTDWTSVYWTPLMCLALTQRTVRWLLPWMSSVLMWKQSNQW